jgi:hypothetical protein
MLAVCCRIQKITSMPRRFLVALSFPGEDRSFVEAVAEVLAGQVGRDRVFYDRWCPV